MIYVAITDKKSRDIAIRKFETLPQAEEKIKNVDKTLNFIAFFSIHDIYCIMRLASRGKKVMRAQAYAALCAIENRDLNVPLRERVKILTGLENAKKEKS